MPQREDTIPDSGYDVVVHIQAEKDRIGISAGQFRMLPSQAAEIEGLQGSAEQVDLPFQAPGIRRAFEIKGDGSVVLPAAGGFDAVPAQIEIDFMSGIFLGGTVAVLHH